MGTPTDFRGGLSEFCAYKENSEAFLKAIKNLQEGRKTKGGRKDRYDQWSDVPTSRAKLLRWAQKSINSNMTKKVIFISGGLHFGDLLAKRMSDSPQYGKSQTLYEVVAS